MINRFFREEQKQLYTKLRSIFKTQRQSGASHHLRYNINSMQGCRQERLQKGVQQIFKKATTKNFTQRQS